MNLKIGDTIFLTKVYCEKFSLSSTAKTLIRVNNNGDNNWLTIKYGGGVHDVHVRDIDWERTIQYRRDKQLETILK